MENLKKITDETVLPDMLYVVKTSNSREIILEMRQGEWFKLSEPIEKNEEVTHYWENPYKK